MAKWTCQYFSHLCIHLLQAQHLGPYLRQERAGLFRALTKPMPAIKANTYLHLLRALSRDLKRGTGSAAETLTFGLCCTWPFGLLSPLGPDPMRKAAGLLWSDVWSWLSTRHGWKQPLGSGYISKAGFVGYSSISTFFLPLFLPSYLKAKYKMISNNCEFYLSFIITSSSCHISKCLFLYLCL